MIAAWMLYCVVYAAGLSVAAVLVERLLLSGRAPVRPVWTGAVALSLVVLADLLTNDADRSTLRSRVVVNVAPPSPPVR